ncbi:hypothetical protein HMPREF1985_00982 [Mitsuokella sp. oral taxon 131 str. W9106]|nr:hypothetical protein HMPREF1985_00982 [Mitsuokella sp. oral taxon 131 str. W9106]
MYMNLFRILIPLQHASQLPPSWLAFYGIAAFEQKRTRWIFFILREYLLEIHFSCVIWIWQFLAS